MGLLLSSYQFGTSTMANLNQKNLDWKTDLPELSKHNNFMAKVLKEDESLYEKYRDVVTPNGYTFDQCIQTGVDNPGHPFIMTVGCVAGDEETYEVFKEPSTWCWPPLSFVFPCPLCWPATSSTPPSPSSTPSAPSSSSSPASTGCTCEVSLLLILQTGAFASLSKCSLGPTHEPQPPSLNFSQYLNSCVLC